MVIDLVIELNRSCSAARLSSGIEMGESCSQVESNGGGKVIYDQNIPFCSSSSLVEPVSGNRSSPRRQEVEATEKSAISVFLLGH